MLRTAWKKVGKYVYANVARGVMISSLLIVDNTLFDSWMKPGNEVHRATPKQQLINLPMAVPFEWRRMSMIPGRFTWGYDGYMFGNLPISVTIVWLIKLLNWAICEWGEGFIKLIQPLTSWKDKTCRPMCVGVGGRECRSLDDYFFMSYEHLKLYSWLTQISYSHVRRKLVTFMTERWRKYHVWYDLEIWHKRSTVSALKIKKFKINWWHLFETALALMYDQMMIMRWWKRKQGHNVPDWWCKMEKVVLRHRSFKLLIGILCASQREIIVSDSCLGQKPYTHFNLILIFIGAACTILVCVSDCDSIHNVLVKVTISTLCTRDGYYRTEKNSILKENVFFISLKVGSEVCAVPAGNMALTITADWLKG